jgi:hypothetical protein
MDQEASALGGPGPFDRFSLIIRKAFLAEYFAALAAASSPTFHPDRR